MSTETNIGPSSTAGCDGRVDAVLGQHVGPDETRRVAQFARERFPLVVGEVGDDDLRPSSDEATNGGRTETAGTADDESAGSCELHGGVPRG